jgi:rod shape-determining protein MreB
LGGGTADVAVISLGGIVAATSVKCAGNKLDQAVADYIKKSFNLAIGDKTAEEVKIKIGSAVPVEEEGVYVIKGRDFLTGLPRSAEIKTNEIVESIDNELREIIKAIKIVFQDTPPELASDIIDNGIILTGGTSQLANLPELILRRTGVRAQVAEEPLFSVIRGTGIALQHLNTYKKSVLAKN